MTRYIDSATQTADYNRMLDDTVSASASFALTSPSERSAALRVIADKLPSQKTRLVQIAAEESGISEQRLNNEYDRMIGQFQLAATVVEDGLWLGASITHAGAENAPPMQDHRRVNIPLGPTLVFAASNFPFAFGVLGTDTASAFAAGCAVIAKGHPGHPRLAAGLADLMRAALHEAVLPPALYTAVEGDGVAVQILRDRRITAAAFTGSIAGGTALTKIAQDREVPIPFYAEMGSANPVFVTPAAWKARRKEILSGLVESMMVGNGQLCTSPGVLMIPGPAPAPEEIAPLLGALRTQPMVTQAIANSFRSGLVDLLETAGVQALASPVQPSGLSASPVLWAAPAQAALRSPSVLAEHFGPTSVIVEYADDEEMRAVVEKMDGQLTASIFAEDCDDVGELMTLLSGKVGRLLLNAWPTGVAVTWSMHHGGPWPSSSNASFGSIGSEAMNRFLRPVTYQNFPDVLLPAPLQEANPWGIPRRVDGKLATATALRTIND